MILYKYLKQEHLLQFKNENLLHINTLYNLRSCENKPILDQLEGRHQIKVQQNNDSLTLSSKEFQKIVMPSLKINEKPEKGKEVSFVLENGVQFDIQVRNSYVFCTTLTRNDSFWKERGYDSHYKIVNPFEFALVLFEKLSQVRIMWCYESNKVKYEDKPILLSNKNKDLILNKNLNEFWNICFTKPTKFSIEKEFRIVFLPEFEKEINPFLLNCPELKKYCKFG